MLNIFLHLCLFCHFVVILCKRQQCEKAKELPYRIAGASYDRKAKSAACTRAKRLAVLGCPWQARCGSHAPALFTIEKQKALLAPGPSASLRLGCPWQARCGSHAPAPFTIEKQKALLGGSAFYIEGWESI